jgi:hypothetical protein
MVGFIAADVSCAVQQMIVVAAPALLPALLVSWRTTQSADAGFADV